MSEFRTAIAFADKAGNTINPKQIVASIRIHGDSEFRKVRAFMLKDGCIVTTGKGE